MDGDENLGDRTSLKPCGHSFHFHCAMQWLTVTASTCPNCRVEVTECGSVAIETKVQPVAQGYADALDDGVLAGLADLGDLGDFDLDVGSGLQVNLNDFPPLSPTLLEL